MFAYRKHKDTKLELNGAKSTGQEGRAGCHNCLLAKGTHVAKQLMPT
jgi:hypothetical protein